MAAKAKKKAATKSKTSRAKSGSKPRATSKAKAGAKTGSRAGGKAKLKTKPKARAKTKAAAKAPAKKKAAAKKPAKKAAASKAGASKSPRRSVVVTTRSDRRRAPLRPAPIPKGKMLSRDFLEKLAKTIRDAVRPVIEQEKGRDVVGIAASGDATFQLDKIAEKALMTHLRDEKATVAYYSEDSGYTTFASGQPTNLLIVDPIDGTRAAKLGFESCVVAVASTRIIERPSLGHIDNACVFELLGNRSFYAERGKGTRMYIDGQYKKPRLSKNTDLESMTWSMTVPARPAELIFPTAAKLIDLSSLKGGFFACNSTSYSLTRLLTNQLDATVDFANRYLRDLGEIVDDHFINAGRGAQLGVAPYDIAASLLIAEEAGCVVTDAYGDSLENVLALDSSTANQQSVIAAANKELHEKLMSFFSTRIAQFERLLERRAELTKKG